MNSQTGIEGKILSHFNLEDLYLHNTYHNKMWLPRQMLLAQLGGQGWLTISNIHKA